MDNLVQIPNFPNYLADKQGNIWSTKKGPGANNGKLVKLKSVEHGGGYLIVNLYRERKKYQRMVHRLILEVFIGPCPKNYWTRHLDGNKKNNNLSNLKWDNPSNNNLDKIKHGTMPDQKGENNGRSKLTESKVIEIRKLLEEGQLIQEKIAEIFNVHRSNITQINTRKIWRHI